MSISLKVTSGDVTINATNGRPSTISDSAKLRQDITEFFTVDIQPSGFGSGIEQLIGVVELSPGMFVSLVDRQIRDGFEVFKALQNSDLRIVRSADEKLLAVTYLTVDQNPSDPTSYYYRVNLVTEKGTQIPLFNPITT